MFHFTCTRCELAIDIDYIPREYVLSDGTTVAMPQRHVWCTTCATIRPAESLDRDEAQAPEPSRASTLPSTSSGVDAAKSDRMRRNLEVRHRRLMEESRRFEAWRAFRRGPAACLKCRSTAFTLPDSAWSDLTHEPCGGTLKAAATLITGTFMRVRPHQYSPEGDLIALGSRTVRQIGEYREAPLELW